MRTIRRAVLLVLGNIALLIGLLLILEGGASAVLFLRDSGATRPLAERLHTTHDPDLGWVNLPDVTRTDLYGPGLTLTTNARGFRGTAQTEPAVPAGRVRIICSGDSFTLGYGVGDTATWCHRLGVLDPRLETVNMGQGGYGFDQAFLWYRRDAAAIDHDVQVLAFITDDFRRMESATFLGYPKPTLAIRGDSLVVENVPVPDRSRGLAGWLTRNARPLGTLRTVQLLRRLQARGQPPAADTTDPARTRAVVARVITELARHHADRGSRLALVLLPTSYELETMPDAAASWTAFLAEEAAAAGVAYLDLFPYVRSLTPPERSALFLAEGEVSYPAAAGHYTAAGNAVVAAEILTALRALEMLPAASVP